MGWPITEIESWDKFLKIVDELTIGSPFTRGYLFRGQAKAKYTLKPSLLRYLINGISSKNAIDIENDALLEFRAHANLHLSSNIYLSEPNTLQWWAIMQHHNAPTRLLDWSTSPYIAAYFAVESEWEEHDGAIWLFHPGFLSNQVKIINNGEEIINDKKFLNVCRDLNPPKSIHTWRPDTLNERMVAQQGLFTLSPDILADHNEIIDTAFNEIQRKTSDVLYHKIIIPNKLKPIFLRNLINMNINANSLYPGVDGLGKTITELTRLVSYYPEKVSKFVTE